MKDAIQFAVVVVCPPLLQYALHYLTQFPSLENESYSIFKKLNLFFEFETLMPQFTPLFCTSVICHLSKASKISREYNDCQMWEECCLSKFDLIRKIFFFSSLSFSPEMTSSGNIQSFCNSVDQSAVLLDLNHIWMAPEGIRAVFVH